MKPDEEKRCRSIITGQNWRAKHGTATLAFILIQLLLATTVQAKSLYVYKAPANVWNPGLPKLVIIIDDMGNNADLGERAVHLPGNVTYAFLPFTPAARSLAEVAHYNNKEIMLHAPMSSLEHLRLGPGALTATMGKTELQAMLRKSIESIPHVKGVNNHMGSELTQMAEPMQWVMEELKCHDLFFIDSRTNSQSIAYQSALQASIPTIQRDVFLDHDDDPAAIAKAFHRAVSLAHRYGSAVVIGHPYPATLDFLEGALSDLSRWQIQLVPASELIPPGYHHTAMRKQESDVPAGHHQFENHRHDQPANLR